MAAPPPLTRGDVLQQFKLRGLQVQADAVERVLQAVRFELHQGARLAAILVDVTALLERNKSEPRAGGGGGGGVRT